jgi:hypothetical protein
LRITAESVRIDRDKTRLRPSANSDKVLLPGRKVKDHQLCLVIFNVQSGKTGLLHNAEHCHGSLQRQDAIVQYEGPPGEDHPENLEDGRSCPVRFRRLEKERKRVWTLRYILIIDAGIQRDRFYPGLLKVLIIHREIPPDFIFTCRFRALVKQEESIRGTGDDAVRLFV